MNVLPFDKKVRVVSALTEGCSLRATERMYNVAHKTVLAVGLAVGEACQRLHDVLMTGLHVNILELDELWAFIHTKQRRVQADDPAEWGDSYTFIGIDATNKAIVSYAVGRRDAATAHDFAQDLRKRISNKPQISSDGFIAYTDAIRMAFGHRCDFGQVVKSYGLRDGDPKDRERCTKIDKIPVIGNPNPEKISTSYVERQNLTIRMSLKRFARSSNAFSKKLCNHKAAVALHVAFYNLCRVHSTLRCTPAMALGVTDHVWSLPELIETADSILPDEPPVPVPLPMLPPHEAEQLSLFAGV